MHGECQQHANGLSRVFDDRAIPIAKDRIVSLETSSASGQDIFFRLSDIRPEIVRKASGRDTVQGRNGCAIFLSRGSKAMLLHGLSEFNSF